MLLYIVVALAMWMLTVVFGIMYTRVYYNKNNYSPNAKKHRIFLIVSVVLVLIIIGNAAASCIIKDLSWLNIPIISMICGVTLYEAAVDAKLHKIPNMMILVQLIGWAAILMLQWLTEGSDILSLLISSAIGGGVIGAFFLLASLLSKGGVGMGDVKLVAVMGLYLGINGITGLLIYALVCSFFYGIYMLITKKGKLKTEVAMAPFFFIGAVIYTTQQIWM